MKRILSLLLLPLAGLASAQEAPLVSSVVKPTATAKRIGRVDMSRFPVYALVQVNYVDAAGTPTGDYYNVSIPAQAGDDPAHPSASVVTFLNAVMSSAAGETGTVPRRFDFRVLKYLKDNGYFPDTNAVVP